MALDVVYGETKNRSLTSTLVDELSEGAYEGTLYLGYPVLATADEQVAVDALLVSEQHGLVAFQFADDVPRSGENWDRYIEEQNRLYSVLTSQLGRYDKLRKGRGLAVTPETITIFGAAPGPLPLEAGDGGTYLEIGAVNAHVLNLPRLDAGVFKALESALQRVTTIKPAKRRTTVKKSESRGAIMKEIEREIANLDRFQKRAAIESPEGPQRIRGLAGSGKTVVLALKAAYLHAQQPEWTIALTFQSRALYQQLDDLVTRFSFEHSNDRPDFEHLRIIHAWGSRSRNGVYSLMADALGVPARDYNYARSAFGSADPFKGACQELLAIASQRTVNPIFDAVLIDEAQDLPPEFFQLVYLFTREPKRIVWAYDELQRLSESAMPSTEELFGSAASGQPNVSLMEHPGEARRDIVLPVCYRNSPWALASAHALGLGIYREEGLVQHFDEPKLWKEVGYDILRGELVLGEHVVLERAARSYPEYFKTYLQAEDAVLLRSFDSEQEQDNWIASQISTNLTEDELEPDDILIVLPDAYTSKRRASRLARLLASSNIESHLVGVESSLDEVFVKGSVAIAHIYRAKGNEAPMVYAVDAQYVEGSFNMITRRNTLFTAITRSRAWVRISGWGPRMVSVSEEVQKVRDNSYRLDFTIPDRARLAQLRRIHRDRSAAEARKVERVNRDLEEVVALIDQGDLAIEDLTPAVKARLLQRLMEDPGAGSDT